MKTFLHALLSVLFLGLGISHAQDYSALPFPVSLGGQAAVYNKSEPFAKIANAVKNDAAIEISAQGNPIIINVNKVDDKGQAAPGASPAVIILQGTSKGSLAGTMDKQKLAPGNYMLSVIADGKTATILFKIE
ncbi:hypothetical protein CfE428DRAFT_3136 [Chthoniobacter flavus Ellin428]|uniref:Secretion system C-terminal sorting domain-containing protein n=1 Tax=Chthoniobacter flavus Ellin428 TaxID=497964 RepID=B4D2L1_9BACT|nr:hypothetical protein [Chthoniobacter flavus]EDY19451.1 hypothetical protein CfE428DRAFT_3136 [Chthoniobacter flavus Ellin428]TCO90423.1 hypothetical protein EV701_11046 [Chthoniobacter flavus]